MQECNKGPTRKIQREKRQSTCIYMYGEKQKPRNNKKETGEDYKLSKVRTPHTRAC